MKNNQEMRFLLNESTGRQGLSRSNSQIANYISTICKVLAAIPRGGGSVYITAAPIAVYYFRGLWLIAPVGAGAVISLTREAVEILAQRHPQQKDLRRLQKASLIADQGVVSYLADLGFTWTMLMTVGVYIGGLEYSHNNFAKIIAPAAAALPALGTTYTKYLATGNKSTEYRLLRYLSGTLRGATSLVFLNVLRQQQYLTITSPIPTALIGAMGSIGFFASLFEISYPKISKTLFALIEILCLNPSMALAFFNFPNSIYAALNNGEIGENFFFANVGISGAFLIFMTLVSLMNLFYPKEVEAEDDKITLIDDDSESDLEAAQEATNDNEEVVAASSWCPRLWSSALPAAPTHGVPAPGDPVYK